MLGLTRVHKHTQTRPKQTNFFIKNQSRKFSSNLTEEDKEKLNSPRVQDDVDLLIVGGGPAGLAAAIRFKQLCVQNNKDYRVVLIEKGPEIGSHILSGAVMEPHAMNELFPNWKEMGAPLEVPVTKDAFYWLTKSAAIRLPTPPQMNNHGNFIISLGDVCRWLGQQAEQLGVEIYPTFAGSEVLYDEKGETVVGVATNDVGIGKDGKPKDTFQRGMELRAKVTLFGEGARGSLTKQLLNKFKLSEGKDPLVYGIGLKEVWEVPEQNHEEGKTIHTAGWPVDLSTWGGSFIYHWKKPYVNIGYVVGLDYSNPYLSPYREFQRFKHHPMVANILKGGKCISYGARALNEGGIQSIPKLYFPGGALMGCSAGFLNVAKVKGSHTAMKSGMIAADSAFQSIERGSNDMSHYETSIHNSWIWKELNAVRNIKPVFQYGNLAGFGHAAIDAYVLKGNEPWTFHHHHSDSDTLKPASECKPIDYPAPDGVLSFDLLTNLARSGTNHNEDQPPHLKLKDSSIPIQKNLPKFANPETRFCPAGVYEVLPDKDGHLKLHINAQNCLHCKTCDIKDPHQNIDYTPPEGGGGPKYNHM